MLTDLQKAAARLSGDELLDAGAISIRLGVPLEEIRSLESDPEFQDERSIWLTKGAISEAKAAFGSGQ